MLPPPRPAACSGLPLPPPGVVLLSIGILKGSPALLRAVSGGVALHMPVSIHPTSQAFLSTCHTGVPELQTPRVMTWCLWEDGASLCGVRPILGQPLVVRSPRPGSPAGLWAEPQCQTLLSKIEVAERKL